VLQLNRSRERTPLMTSNIKYVGMDMHKEHADFPIMPTLGKSLLSTSCWACDSVF
jgi:hypothetical protein